jgi:hypothetical protein
MNHREAVDKEMAELYVNQELSPEDELAFEEHLLYCEECRNQIHLLEATIADIENNQKARFRDKTFINSELTVSKKFHRMSFTRTAAVIILLVGLGGIVMIVFNKLQTDSSIPVFTKNTYDSLMNVNPAETSHIIDSGRKFVSDIEMESPVYAMENFRTNSFYENLVENSYRNYEITITSPVKDTLSKIPVFSWEGTIGNALTLIIMNNREKKVFIEKIKSGTSPDLILDPGLYYWQLQDKTQTLITGRFIYLPSTVRQ